MITVWEALNRAVCVRSDARGHVVRARLTGGQWASEIGVDGRVKRYASAADAERAARAWLRADLVAVQRAAHRCGDEVLYRAATDWISRL